MNTALASDDPVLVLEHQALFQETGLVPDGPPDWYVPLGAARRVRGGDACTVVTYGAMVGECMAAAEATGIDVAAKILKLRDGEVAYDTLIVAAGSRHHYFGHPEWEEHAPGLKTVEDATGMRRRIFAAFEAAERTDDAAERAALLTFVVVGGGHVGRHVLIHRLHRRPSFHREDDVPVVLRALDRHAPRPEHPFRVVARRDPLPDGRPAVGPEPRQQDRRLDLCRRHRRRVVHPLQRGVPDHGQGREGIVASTMEHRAHPTQWLDDTSDRAAAQ